MKHQHYIPAILILICLASCKKFLDVGMPKSKIRTEDLFKDENTTRAAVLGMYNEVQNGNHFASGGRTSIATMAGLTSDELRNMPKSEERLIQFELNSIHPSNDIVGSLWTSMYKSIYMANALLTGIAGSDMITDSVKAQFNGEALFMRAFCYFYLVNTFDDVPLVLGTDYEVNNSVERTPKGQVYEQMVEDLQKAADLLPENYMLVPGERITPNKFSATALLARVHLYMGNWSAAASAATKVIDRKDLYDLEALPNVFLKNMKEAIWQIQPISFNGNGATAEASAFEPANILYANALQKGVPAWFETNDHRWDTWMDSLYIESGTLKDTLYFPRKYKQFDANYPLTEYSIILRLAEQYLIRAEARAQLGLLTGPGSAASDINAIRDRAGLGNTTSVTAPDLLADVAQERRIELLCEWGHRWYDLKRTGRSVAEIRLVKPDFAATDTLYPLPQSEFLKNPKLRRQNEGY